MGWRYRGHMALMLVATAGVGGPPTGYLAKNLLQHLQPAAPAARWPARPPALQGMYDLALQTGGGWPRRWRRQSYLAWISGPVAGQPLAPLDLREPVSSPT